MTKRDDSITRKPYDPRSKRPDEPLTDAEMGRAVRELHRWLSRVVGESEGLSDEQVWARRKIMQVPATRKMVAGMVEISAKPAVVAAVEAYAARGVRDLDARGRGHDCGHVAILLARSLITPAEAVEQSRRWRQWAPPIGVDELEGVQACRSERERWRVAYRELGLDADVWPAPDTRRGLRGDLLDLYRMVSKPVVVVDPATGEKWEALPNGRGRLVRTKRVNATKRDIES